MVGHLGRGYSFLPVALAMVIMALAGSKQVEETTYRSYRALLHGLIDGLSHGIAGSYIAARFAPRRPMPHALILGVLSIVVSTIGAVLMWNKGPAFGPRWYPVALIVMAIPCAWARQTPA